MKVLLDENLPHQLRQELAIQEVYTVQYQGWSGIRNGLLLSQATAAGFDVMVTMDNGIRYQQHLASLPLAVIIVRAVSNDIDDLRPLVPQLLEAISGIKPKTIVRIG